MPNPLPNPLEEITERLQYIEYAVREQIARIYQIEKHLGMVPEEPPVSVPVEIKPDPLGQTSQQFVSEDRPELAQTAEPVAEGPISIDPAVVAERSSVIEVASPVRQSLEQRIGGNWFSRIGIIAIVLAVGFFIKYAFDNEWIGPGQRVLGGLAAGLGLLVFGERLRDKGMRAYAQVISGGGIAILFLSIYAAHAYYELLPAPIAFAAMVVIAALAVGLAVRQNALSLATLGTLGAFVTPVLLSTGRDAQVALYLYLIVVDLAVLAIAYYKRWRLLDVIAFIGTTILSYGWVWEWFDAKRYFSTLGFTGALFLIFAVVPLVHAAREGGKARWIDVLLIAGNAVAFLFTAMALTREYQQYYGLEALILAGVSALLARQAIKLEPHGRELLVRPYAAMGLLFLTVAIPFQFDNQVVTILFALEAGLLFWAGIRYSILLARIASLVIFVIALFHWLIADVAHTESEMARTHAFSVLFNGQILGCLAMIACLVVASQLYRSLGGESPSRENRILREVCTIGAHMLALMLLSLETYDFYQARILAIGADWGTPGYTPENLEAQRELGLAQQMALSIVWALYGAGLFAYGIVRSRRNLRIVALILLVLVSLKVFLIDLQELDRIYRIISFFALGAILLAVSYFYQRSLRRGRSG